MTICIVDTSVLVELLDVPGKASRHETTLTEFEQRNAAGEQFLVPVAVLFETGNHIAQVSEGAARRSRAQAFVKLVRSALDGGGPFVATPLPSPQVVLGWLDRFPDRAVQGVSLADESIVALWESQQALNRMRRVYVWSFDAHLVGYDSRTE